MKESIILGSDIHDITSPNVVDNDFNRLKNVE